MARRASSSLHPGLIMASILGIVCIVIAGKFLLGRPSASFGDVAKLDMAELLENGNSLRGNEYMVEGQIDEKLQWTADRGQLVSLKVTTAGGSDFIAIEIPDQFNKLNIDSKQKYAFRVKFRQGGIAVATAVTRL